MSIVRCRPNLPLALVALAAMLWPTSPVSAADPLRCEIKAATEKLRDYLAGRRIKAVAVGDVTNSDPNSQSTAGPAIKQLLIEELQRVEIEVKLRAEVGLSLSFKGTQTPLPENRDLKQLTVVIRFTATFTADNSQEDVMVWKITDLEASSHILGLSVNLPSKADDRRAQTVLAASKPSSAIDGTVALPGPKSLSGIEVLVDDKPLVPTDRDGFATVKLSREQTYAIRLSNRSGIEMAARVSVDGINIFHFSEVRRKDGKFEGCPQYDMVLIPPKGTVTIVGWHRSNEKSAKFKIAEYAETAAAKMGKSTDIGTITATFCASWTKTPPEGEPEGGTRAVGQDGTGFGEDAASKFQPVERTIGAVRAAVAVRYTVPVVK